MNVSAIPLYDQLPLGGATHLIDVSYEDLTETATATGQTLVPLNAATGDVVEVVAMRLVTPFKDASDNAYNTTTMTVGDTDSSTRFLSSTQLNENGAQIVIKVGTLTTRGFAYTAAKEIQLAFGSMSGKKLSDIDVGRLLLYVRVVNLTKFGPYT